MVKYTCKKCGSTIKNITKGYLDELEIPIVPLEKQKDLEIFYRYIQRHKQMLKRLSEDYDALLNTLKTKKDD